MPADTEQNKQPVIRISGLRKKFGNLIAVDGLSLEIFKGEILGFLGPNGAGKTTTINMICGLITPTDGEIHFQGNWSRQHNNIRSSIGICPQENIYWPKLTLYEQLKFMGEMYGKTDRYASKRSQELLKMMGLESKSNVLARKLSGGMKRRLNICLALIHDPEILILDEPEAGLDPQSRILVRGLIKSLAKEKTIILTTHNMDEADRLSDRVAIIDHGKLLLVNTPENLKKSIGEGDILEITLDTEKVENPEKVEEVLLQICDKAKISGNSLIIRSKNLIGKVSEITQKINGQDYKIREMTMRENTLEDVFIHLTGRKLRQ